VQWAKKCIDYNNSAINFIKNNKDITHVILSSSLINYLDNSNNILTVGGLEDTSLKLIVNSYRETILQLSEAGKKVLFISPPPKDGTNIGECLERKYGPALLFKKDCSVSLDNYLVNQASVLEALKEFNGISKVLYLSDILCGDLFCKTEIDNNFIYRDNGHLSIEGSISVLGSLRVTEL
jgi:SGNH domain (fused to AT3 domains)